MNNIRDYNIRICISHNNITYKIFVLGFLNDGGYFLSDLSEGEEYIATKIKTTGRTIRKIVETKIDYDNTYSITLRKPKISHHIDGTAHISGNNIISGYNSDTSAKGLSIESFNLSGENDGGPIFGFNIGLNVLKNFPVLDEIEKKKPHLILESPFILDFRENIDENFCYDIEGYYILKNKISYSKRIINKDHPIYGKYKLRAVPTPQIMPGIIAIGCIKDNLGFNKDSFSLNGVPGVIAEDGSWEQLAIVRRKHNDTETDKYKTLNYPS